MSPKWQMGERIQGHWEIYEILKGGLCVAYVVYDHVGLTFLLLLYNQQRTPYAYETKKKVSLQRQNENKLLIKNSFRRASSRFAGICLSVLSITAMQTSIY